MKVGDWVRNNNNEIFQLEELHMWQKDLYSLVKLWLPDVGEWCWYKHCLVKVLSIRDTSYQVSAPMFGEQWTGSIELEPFTNQLPTYIKDK